jgi:hypothetical protein
MSDWQKFYATSDGMGCNPVELKKAAQAEIDDLRHALRRLVGAVKVAFERPDLLAVQTDVLNALVQAALKLEAK